VEQYEPNADGDSWATYILVAALEASVALGNEHSVARLSFLVEPAAHLAIGGVFFVCPARVLGDAAAFLSRPDEARAWYDRALGLAGKIGFRPEVALVHLGLAELIAGHFRAELAEGREHLAFAIPELEAMKMTPALERALALQERLSGRAPARPSYPDGLSEREVEVLRLIARGQSNKQIAEELVLSVRTVERHIANVYAKIGASTKAQATAYAFSQNLS
jgi:DNA-binding CsgD family transcriptional regulator